MLAFSLKKIRTITQITACRSLLKHINLLACFTVSFTSKLNGWMDRRITLSCTKQGLKGPTAAMMHAVFLDVTNQTCLSGAIVANRPNYNINCHSQNISNDFSIAPYTD